MLSELPAQLKSGRRLVATAADGNVGLYTFPDIDDDYRVVTLAGSVYRGDGERIPQPPEGRWRYLRHDQDDLPDDPVDGGAEAPGPTHAATNGADAPPVSPIHLCADCERDTRGLDHSHTVGAPALTLCCACTRQRGFVCGRQRSAVRA